VEILELVSFVGVEEVAEPEVVAPKPKAKK